MGANSIIIVLFFFLLNCYSYSQESGTILTKEEKDSILENIGHFFQDFYVFPEQGNKIREILRRMNADATFDTITDPLDFRKSVQTVIRNTVADKHIIFIYTGSQSNKNEDTRDSLPVSDLKLEYDKRKESNFGIPELKVLENNIGYLKVSKFTSPELFGPVLRASSEYLRNVEGLILDLRSRGGGSSESVVLLLSYFLPPEKPVFYWLDREGKEIERNYTLPYVDGQRFKNIPIAILTSQATFSGSEAFCYAMKNYGNATLIGETTKGGAHTYLEMFPSDKYLILVPHQRVLGVKTNRNWEGSGVIPTVSASSEESLEVAKRILIEKMEKN